MALDVQPAFLSPSSLAISSYTYWLMENGIQNSVTCQTSHSGQLYHASSPFIDSTHYEGHIAPPYSDTSVPPRSSCSLSVGPAPRHSSPVRPDSPIRIPPASSVSFRIYVSAHSSPLRSSPIDVAESIPFLTASSPFDRPVLSSRSSRVSPCRVELDIIVIVACDSSPAPFLGPSGYTLGPAPRQARQAACEYMYVIRLV